MSKDTTMIACKVCGKMLKPQGIGPHMRMHGVGKSLTIIDQHRSDSKPKRVFVKKPDWTPLEIDAVCKEFTIELMVHPCTDQDELFCKAMKKHVSQDKWTTRIHPRLIECESIIAKIIEEATANQIVSEPVVVRIPPPPVETVLEKASTAQVFGEFGRRLGYLVDKMMIEKPIIVPVKEPEVIQVHRDSDQMDMVCKRTKVLIAGLLHDQFLAVEKQSTHADWVDVMPPNLKLVYFSKDQHSNQIPMTADYSIGVVKFLSHGLDGSMRQKFGKCYYPMSGGISSIMATLVRIAARIKGLELPDA